MTAIVYEATSGLIKATVEKITPRYYRVHLTDEDMPIVFENNTFRSEQKATRIAKLRMGWVKGI